MAHEIEAKILNIDAEVVEQKLVALGAKKVRNTRLTVDWYRPKGIKEGDDPWFLRIRTDSEGTHEVTWKAKSSALGIARKHKEINFLIPEPDKLVDLFEELSLEQYAHQEKDRISYLLRDWTFDIDTYPKMPAYMEIEGSSETHIKEAMKLLGVLPNQTWPDGERTLIQREYGLDWYDMRF